MQCSSLEHPVLSEEPVQPELSEEPTRFRPSTIAAMNEPLSHKDWGEIPWLPEEAPELSEELEHAMLLAGVLSEEPVQDDTYSGGPSRHPREQLPELAP